MEIIIPLLSIITGAVGTFFALKTQVDKLSIVVNNNTTEISALRKILESMNGHYDSEHTILKKRIDDHTRQIKSHASRLHEIEKHLDRK